MGNSILIIDDELDICFLLGNMLKKRNLQVAFANTLQEGFYQLSLKQPAIVFMDINLPDGSGIDAIYSIKQRYAPIKVVVISAYDSAKDRHTADIEGADAFIAKPFNQSTIYEVLDNLQKTSIKVT